MKSKIIVCLLVLGFAVQQTYSQRRQLKSTKVVFVVHEKSNKIESLELFEKERAEMLVKKHPNKKFFFGELKGSYKIANNMVRPNRGAVSTMYTDKKKLPGDLFLPRDLFLPGDLFIPGDMFSLNRSKVKVKEVNASQIIFNTL